MKGRYSYQTNDFEPRRIVLSCIYVMKHYHDTDERSSFAFVGANSEGEGVECTKRFRFYRRMMNTYFGRKTFEHLVDEKNSAYLMLRRCEVQRNNLSVKEVEDFFKHIYMLS